MDKRTSLLELLAEVEPKVAEQNDRLTAQYVAISRLAERGQDIAEALSVLSQVPATNESNQFVMRRPVSKAKLITGSNSLS